MTTFESLLFDARVRHERTHPAQHSFEYGLPVFAFWVEELDRLDSALLLFGHNTARPVSLHDADYLQEGPGPIDRKLAALAIERGAMPGTEDTPSRALLITGARFFGYVFNPVSFHFIFAEDGVLRMAAAEVNNTFGEKHVYLLGDESRQADDNGAFIFETAKTFHVSPFNDLSGAYRFRLGDPRKRLDLSVELIRDGASMFSARLWSEAEGKPLSDRALLAEFMRHPTRPALTYPRILREAISLRGRRHLPVHAKPAPQNDMTIRRNQASFGGAIGSLLSWPQRRIDALSRTAVLRYLKPLEWGRLAISTPDGERSVFGDSTALPAGQIDVRDPAFFQRVARAGGVGFGETYVDGLWETPDLLSVLRVLGMNLQHFGLARTLGLPGFLTRGLSWAGHLAHRTGQRNDPRGAKANIHAHYDRSNELFERFLDPTMAYSSAIFEHPDQDLEAAQRNKLRELMQRAGIADGSRVLEIGCGWGGFAQHVLENSGCRYTGITVSENQYEYTQDRLRKAGLADRASIRLQDYRDAEGEFDAVVSIEMLEAVGHQYHPVFFEAVDRLLAPGGISVHQAITIRDQRYAISVARPDWIRKWIFPGGQLPSLARMVDVARDHTTLSVFEAEDIGQHYPRTLSLWREAFLDNWEMIAKAGFDERFRRMWLYYLTYCQAGFETGVISNILLTLARSPLVGHHRLRHVGSRLP